jgi:predicted permease
VFSEWFNSLRLLARDLIGRQQLERDLSDELRFHFEQQVEKGIKSGLSREEAERQARLAFGETDEAKEECREARGVAFIETVIQDLRYALRQLRRNPSFTVVALVALALGIGANTAIFSVVNEVLLQRLPYPAASRLVLVWSTFPQQGIEISPVTPADFRDWESQGRVFEQMAGSTDQLYTLTGMGEPQQIIGYSYSARFFEVLGSKPFLGRTFLASEDQPGHDHVVVLSYQLWQRLFGGAQNVLGKSITLSGAPYIVIGVMPPGFGWPQNTELWTPLALAPSLWTNRQASFLRVMARLKAGVTLRQAQQQMEAIVQGLDRRYPETNAGEGVKLVSLREQTVGDIQPALLMLLAAVGFVLLIACANVANLLLARTTARQKEIAIRTALGASRHRLMRQLLTESALLSLIGGALGFLLALWGTRFLLAIFPNHIANLSIPKVTEIPVGGRALGFTLVVAIATGLLFGLLPSLRGASPHLNESLKEGGRTSAAGIHGQRIRSVLVVSEIALALALSVGAGLMIKSFARLVRGDLGLNPGHVLTMEAFLPHYKYAGGSARRNFVHNALERIKTLPGVQSCAVINFLPLGGFWGTVNFLVEGRPVPKPADEPEADNRIVTPGYFKTMAIPLVRGRDFTETDSKNAPHVAVINRMLAARYWPNSNPVGKRLNLGTPGKPDWWQIVGVMGDVKTFGLEKATHLAIYRPFAQTPFPLIAFTVRTGPRPLSLASSVKRAIWQVDKDQALFKVVTMKQLAAESVSLRRVSMLLLGGFSLLALILAAIGIYGVISYSVSQRFHEFGIRMALGAERRDVLRLVVGKSMTLALIGVASGIAIALGLARLAASLLYGVTPTDLFTIVTVSCVVMGVALLASFFPARRAASIDPMQALRHE